MPSQNHYIVEYKIYPSGVVNVSAQFTALEREEEKVAKSEAELMATLSPKEKANYNAKKDVLEVPRIGVRFRLPSALDNIQYFGRGPEENYIDRHKGTLIGLYSAKAWDLYFPYARPQENGHRSDTRWLFASSNDGKGLLIVAEETIGFNALRNSVEDFDSQESDKPYQWNNFSAEEIANKNETKAKDVRLKQTHAVDIEPQDFVEICLDWRQQGVAGYNSWGARPTPQASIYADDVCKWSFSLIPVSTANDVTNKAYLKY